MNEVHIHLLITHLPIIGSILGAFVLAYGIWSMSADTKIAAYFLFMISAIGASVAYFTGEGAEESVEHLQGVVEASIKVHEQSALYALIALIVLGLTSFVGIYHTFIKSPLARTTAIIILLLSIISFGLVARTGYLGGQIRHTEITSTAPSAEGSEIDTD